MRFYLVWQGQLPASGNKSKPEDVRKIRDELHPQLQFLWKDSRTLRQLRSSARVLKLGVDPRSYWNVPESPLHPDPNPDEPVDEDHVDLTAPITQGPNTYIPLVRESLSLNCSLDILFLRQDDPGQLVRQGGDLEGRMKTLLDALRMPHHDVAAKYPQSQSTTYCLLEDDSLVSGFKVTTGRLLAPKTTHPHEVHLVIDVTIRVLRVGPWNVCLTGD